MPILPKPYPDEIIGSVIARASNHSGLPMKPLIRGLFGRSQSTTSMLMGGNLSPVSKYTGLNIEELLINHTIIPYTIAFMPQAQQIALLSKCLNLRKKEESLSSLTKIASHGVPFRRVCNECISYELQTYGETYWHRAHLLPATHICVIHGTRLRRTDIPLRGMAQIRSAQLPDSLKSYGAGVRLPEDALIELTNLSVRALNRELDFSIDWLALHRTSARQLGYEMSGGGVASHKLARDVLKFYGYKFLADAGCEISPRESQSWPTLMVRPNTASNLAAPKHALVHVFLQLAGQCDGQLGYRAPGKPSRDYVAFDAKVLAHIKTTLSEATDCRHSVKDLLSKAGALSAFRHDRSRFPKTSEYIEEFRKTNQSQRQVGRRPHWRKRLGLEEKLLISACL